MKHINGTHVGMRLAIVGWMLCAVLSVYAQNVRETIRLDEGWKFSLGNADDPAKDFGCGTEYFNYLTKANSIHTQGPIRHGDHSCGYRGEQSLVRTTVVYRRAPTA